MAPKDGIPITGHVLITKKDRRTGEVKEVCSGKNLVVNDGEEQIASQLRGVGSKPTHMAVGNSANAPAEGQSALQGTELARVAFSNESQTGNQITYTASFTGSWSGTVEEAGIFDAASAGTMLARFLTGTFDKDSNDEIEIRWTLTVGS